MVLDDYQLSFLMLPGICTTSILLPEFTIIIIIIIISSSSDFHVIG